MSADEIAARQASFWARVDRTEGSAACWPWTGGIRGSGYGGARVAGHDINASRAAWLLAGNDIPDDQYVCHRCDNKLCCNPRHLFLGTQRENVADMDRKGRGVRTPRGVKGEAHYAARLTDQQVEEIRAAAAAGVSRHRDIAAMYGITRQYVGILAAGGKRA